MCPVCLTGGLVGGEPIRRTLRLGVVAAGSFYSGVAWLLGFVCGNDGWCGRIVLVGFSSKAATELLADIGRIVSGLFAAIINDS